jgi:hypothetical protein
VTREEAAVLVATLAAAHPRVKLDEANVRIYARSLTAFELAEGQRAVARLIVTSTFFPSIAEIRRSIAEERLGLPEPELAWEIVRAGPALPDETFPDENDSDARWAAAQAWRIGLPVAIKRAYADIGGRGALTHTDNMEVLRAQFMRLYEAFREEEITTCVTVDLPRLSIVDEPASIAIREGGK